jgi:lariat debranching enzyme
LRIAGFSGIYKDYDYKTGYHETIPYDEKQMRSIYHTREFEIFKLSNYENQIDIMLSHDWPTHITMFGDEKKLLQYKKHFKADIEKGVLGSPAAEFLLKSLQPKYWFSAHLHCKFAAVVNHSKDNKSTKFLALDKCLPNRDFLQVMNFPILTKDFGD